MNKETLRSKPEYVTTNIGPEKFTTKQERERVLFENRWREKMEIIIGCRS